MENLIEHEGKKYRVVTEPVVTCHCDFCALNDDIETCAYHEEKGFPTCTEPNCHFELVEETNQ
jgi:hypothetical protein